MTETLPPQINEAEGAPGSTAFVLELVRDSFPEVPTLETIDIAKETLGLAPRDAAGNIVNDDGSLVDDELVTSVETLSTEANWRLSPSARKAGNSILRAKDESKLSATAQENFSWWRQGRENSGQPGDFAAYQEFAKQWRDLDNDIIGREQVQRTRSDAANSTRILYSTDPSAKDAHTSNENKSTDASQTTTPDMTGGDAAASTGSTEPKKDSDSSDGGRDRKDGRGKRMTREEMAELRAEQEEKLALEHGVDQDAWEASTPAEQSSLISQIQFNLGQRDGEWIPELVDKFNDIVGREVAAQRHKEISDRATAIEAERKQNAFNKLSAIEKLKATGFRWQQSAEATAADQAAFDKTQPRKPDINVYRRSALEIAQLSAKKATEIGGIALRGTIKAPFKTAKYGLKRGKQGAEWTGSKAKLAKDTYGKEARATRRDERAAKTEAAYEGFWRAASDTIKTKQDEAELAEQAAAEVNGAQQ